MAAKKEISGFIKLQIKGGQANPAPPVGPALGQRGVNIMEFCNLGLQTSSGQHKVKTIIGQVGLLPRTSSKNVVHHFRTKDIIRTEGVLHGEKRC